MKYEQWNLRRGGSDEARRQLELAGVPPLCAVVLCARGLDTPEKAREFLANGPELLHDPFLMRDMDRAAVCISQAVERGDTIAVYGDYDVDGITSTCLLTEFLRERGGHVICYIPDRTGEGYGLNRGAVDRLGQQGVKLIVTVDCGITAAPEVAYAKALGIDVVVTDHHHCKDNLPDAAAVVDPRRPDCTYPFKELAGVGVALKVALALTPRQDWAGVLEQYGELAAIGTVADVMRLTDENRAIVTLGLERLAHTCRPGAKGFDSGGFSRTARPHRRQHRLRPGSPDQRRWTDGTGRGCGGAAAHPGPPAGPGPSPGAVPAQSGTASHRVQHL